MSLGDTSSRLVIVGRMCSIISIVVIASTRKATFHHILFWLSSDMDRKIRSNTKTRNNNNRQAGKIEFGPLFVCYLAVLCRRSVCQFRQSEASHVAA